MSVALAGIVRNRCSAESIADAKTVIGPRLEAASARSEKSCDRSAGKVPRRPVWLFHSFGPLWRTRGAASPLPLGADPLHGHGRRRIALPGQKQGGRIKRRFLGKRRHGRGGGRGVVGRLRSLHQDVVRITAGRQERGCLQESAARKSCMGEPLELEALGGSAACLSSLTRCPGPFNPRSGASGSICRKMRFS